MEQITFNFFHIGKDVRQPTLMAASIRTTNPLARIRQLTDISTPQVDGVDECHRIEGDRSSLMLFRAKAYSLARLADGVNLFVDTDMLVLREISSEEFDSAKQFFVCRRHFNRDALVNINFHGMQMNEFAGKTLDTAWPYLGCFIAARRSGALHEIYEAMQKLPQKYQYWYGDQIALKYCATKLSGSIGSVSEYQYAFLPDDECAVEAACLDDRVKIIHFKGARKKMMSDAASRILQ